jgi:transposase
MTTQKYISIPKGLPTAILQDGLERHLVHWYMLKSLYVGGRIHNYRSRYKEIADTFGIGQSTLRKWIGLIKEQGWAHRQGKDLVLISRERLRERYNLSKGKYRTTTDNLLEWLKAKAIQENILKQEYEYKRKYVAERIKESKDKSQSLIRFLNSNLNKDFKAHQAIQIKRFNQSIQQGKQSRTNPYFTLSRQGIASCFNRKSKRTGTYQLNKLKKLGYILKDETNLVYLKTCSYAEYLIEKQYSGMNNIYLNGKVYRKLSNNIVIGDIK